MSLKYVLSQIRDVLLFSTFFISQFLLNNFSISWIVYDFIKPIIYQNIMHKIYLFSLKCMIEWFHFGCVGLTTKPKGKW